MSSQRLQLLIDFSEEYAMWRRSFANHPRLLRIGTVGTKRGCPSLVGQWENENEGGHREPVPVGARLTKEWRSVNDVGNAHFRLLVPQEKSPIFCRPLLPPPPHITGTTMG